MFKMFLKRIKIILKRIKIDGGMGGGVAGGSGRGGLPGVSQDLPGVCGFFQLLKRRWSSGLPHHKKVSM